MADRVTGDQPDNVVCRTSAYYASPTTNCCGCPEDVFVVLRFSCPSLSPLVVLCFLVLLFCFACHISGGIRHLFVLFCSFCLFPYFFSCFFVRSRLPPFVCRVSLSHLDRKHSYAVPVVPSTTARHSIVYSAYCVSM